MSPQDIVNPAKYTIAISSCKGGVGKSTVAAQLAFETANRGLKVGLIDTDIFGPSIPTLFNMANQKIYTNEFKQFIPVEVNNLKIMSFGFLLGDGPAVMRGPMVTNYVSQILQNTAWGKLDYLFIDMPPGTGDVQLTITQTLRLSAAIIVTTPQTLSLIDVARGILMFEKVDVPILGLVENMSYFVCDQCDKKHYIFGKNTSQTLKNRFGIDILAELPMAERFTQSIDVSSSNQEFSKLVDRVTKDIADIKNKKMDIPDVAFDVQHVTLTWKNGKTIKVNNKSLRLSCECALCINEMTGEKTLKNKTVRDNIAPTAIMRLGNYAIGIDWNDKHTSGIYPYSNIQKLGKQVN